MNARIKGSRFNRTNLNIDWAAWTWNPISGCLNGCDYCYAQQIYHRFHLSFEPALHQERLDAPRNTRVPRHPTVRDRNVFVCSMAELFGDWVPQSWIDDVLGSVRSNPQWTYIFLTKNPTRLAEIDFPPHCWVGATIDTQRRVSTTIDVFKRMGANGNRPEVLFISIEPFVEEIQLNDLEVVDWVILGGRSRTSRVAAMQPQVKWVDAVIATARAAGCRIYCKPNLLVQPTCGKPKEFPVGVRKEN